MHAVHFHELNKHRAPVCLTRTATASFKTASATIKLDRNVTRALRHSRSRPKMRPAGSYNPHFKEEHPNLCVTIFPRVREMGAVLSRRARPLWPANVLFYLSGSIFRFLGELDPASVEGRPLTPPSPSLRNTRFLERSVPTTKTASTTHP